MTRAIKRRQCSLFMLAEPLPAYVRGCVSPWEVQIQDGIPPSLRFVESVRRSGVIEPIITATVGDGLPSTVWVASGRRRVAAARVAGLARIDEKRYSLRDWLQFNRLTLELQYLHSANPMAEFGAALRMMDAGASIEDICECTGMLAGQVKRLTRLADLHPELRRAVVDERLGVNIALACIPLSGALQQRVYEAVRAGVRVTRPMIGALVDEQRQKALAQVVQDPNGQNGLGELFSQPSHPVTLETLANRLSIPTLRAVLTDVGGDPAFAAIASLLSECLLRRSQISR